jgi:hypothetical protein
MTTEEAVVLLSALGTVETRLGYLDMEYYRVAGLCVYPPAFVKQSNYEPPPGMWQLCWSSGATDERHVRINDNVMGYYFSLEELVNAVVTSSVMES